MSIAAPPEVYAVNRILFVSKRGGNSEIYAMNADGTNQRNRSNNAAAEDDAGWGVR